MPFRTKTRPFWSVALGALLVGGSLSACAQEPPPSSPPTGDSGTGDAIGPPRFIYDILEPMSADAALDLFEAELNGTSYSVTQDARLSLKAYADSAQHFARTLALARAHSAQGGESGGYGLHLLFALRSMAPWRPTYRSMLRDAAREGDYRMAATVIRMLAADPRAGELAELRRLNRSLPSDAYGGPFAHALTDYDSALSMDEQYEALPSFEAKLDYIEGRALHQRSAELRELHRERPAQVEAWGAQQQWPSGDGEEWPPVAELHRQYHVVLEASPRLIPPIRMPGPLSPGLLPP